MPRKPAMIHQEKALEGITPRQQTFIELLLSGKSISDAALEAGISRRTATYWLANPEHSVTIEYEMQRIVQRQRFQARVAALHEKALAAMEASLDAEAPPAIRFQAAKFLYEQHLASHFNMQPPGRPQELVEKETDQAGDYIHFLKYDADRLDAIPDD
jgi:hypothetical protein